MTGPRGFTLVEILVALVILQVGLLGATGTLVLAGSVLRRARDLEWAVQEVRGVADSLSLFGAAGGGGRDTDFGRIEWTAEAGSITVDVRITAWRREEPDPVVDVATRVPAGGVEGR